MKHVLAALAGLLLMASAAHAAPPLYAYRGAGCTGVAAFPQLEAMLGRRVDGVVDFNDFGLSPSLAVSNLNWELGCWQGNARNKIAISIGLAFKGMSTAQVAAGGMDEQYAQMARSLVSHGFTTAYVRLGWEPNGGWYPWGRQGKTYAAAFEHVAPIIKANCPACTVVYNPTIGIDFVSMAPSGSAISTMGWDFYASTWNCGGCTQTEPSLWNGNLTATWGASAIGTFDPKQGYYPQLPVVIPEFGVGSRGDGHGACAGAKATDCDDPVFMANAIALFTKVNAQFVGLWDYNAGDYNSEVSGDQRPGEAAVVIKTWGSPNLRAILNEGATPYQRQPAPTFSCIDTKTGGRGCHFTAIQTGPSAWKVPLWAIEAHSIQVTIGGASKEVQLFEPSRGIEPTKHLGSSGTFTLDIPAGGEYVVSIRQ
jgi:hypothetical protein